MADIDNPCSVESRCSIEGPCNKVCVVDPAASLCIGCGRTLAEIGGWIGFTPDERRRIMTELPNRLASLAPRKRRANAP